MMSSWRREKMIFLILGAIFLDHIPSAYAVCQRPTGDEYANTIFTPDMTEYPEYSFVYMECQSGYSEGDGAPSSYCDSGNWSPSPLICYSDCERPGVYDDVTYNPNQDSYTHGSVVTYECVDGTSDVLGDAQATCQNGIWDPRPTIANPSCSGIRTVPPTTRPKTSATTAGSTTSTQPSTRTDATAESEPTTGVMMTTVTGPEETEAMSTSFESTENPTIGESLTPTYATDLPGSSTVSTISEITDLNEGSTVTDATNQTDGGMSTVSEITDLTESSNVTDATDLTKGRTVSETTDLIQSEGSTVTDSTDQTESITTITYATEPNDGTSDSGPTSRMQTGNTETLGTDQPTGESSSTGSSTTSLVTEYTGISTSENTKETQHPTTIAATLESEQTTTEQSSDMTTDILDTSTTVSPSADFSTQATNSVQTRSPGQTDMTDLLVTGDASTETITSHQATLTTMPSAGSQGMTSSALGTRPLQSDSTTLSRSSPTEDTITSRRTEGSTTQASTQSISDMSTGEIRTLSAGTSDEKTLEPTEDMTTSADVAEGTTVRDLTSGLQTTEAAMNTIQTTPPVEDMCNGQCDETREICVETSCECQDGFQRPYEGSLCEPTTYYSISMTLLEIDGVTAVFTTDLRTTGSDAFNALQLTVCTAVTAVLDDAFAGFKTCSVTGFSAGSVIADIRIGFTNTAGVDIEGILDVVMTSELYQTTNSNFTINPSETSVTPTDECELGLDDCSPRADCRDLAEKAFTCQCWDGYADYSPDGYDGRNCAAYNWKLITIVVGSCTGALLLAACVLLVCGGNIIKRCTKKPKVKTSGTRSPSKQDKGVETGDGQDIIPWRHREKDEEIFYAHTVDGHEARRLNSARNVRGNESYDNAEAYDLDDYRSSKYDSEERYVPIVM